MRYISFFSAFYLLSGYSLQAQTACTNGYAYDSLDVNNLTIPVMASAELLWKSVAPLAFLQGNTATPGQDPIQLQMAVGLWVGVLYPGGNLKMAAQMYGGATGSVDYWSGPLLVNVGTTYHDLCSHFDRLWKVHRTDIDAHIADFTADGVINQPVPFSLLSWPGRGNAQSLSTNGFELPDQPLAPFFDRNENGQYEPLQGDYPAVKGDQAIWWVFNDQGGGAIHGESNSVPIRIETQVIAYAFADAANESIFNTAFYDIILINRAPEVFDSAYTSMWLDPDLGYFLDDFIGCSPADKLAFTTNPNDSLPTYPALGIKVLDGPVNELGENTGFSSFMYYNNNIFNPIPATNDPAPDIEFYHYMTGRWRDGTPLTFGENGYDLSGIPTPYAFPDAPTDPEGWSMYTYPLPQNDRRILINSGPFQLLPGECTAITYAIMWKQISGFPCPDVSLLLAMGEEIADFYAQLTPVNETVSAP